MRALRQQLTGVEYRKFIQHHVRETGKGLEAAATGIAVVFNETESPIVETMIDEYNARGYDHAFWRRDAAELLDEICGLFTERMSAAGQEPEDWLKFQVFQIISINYAQMAYEQRGLREFMGIRKSWLRR